MGKKMQLKKENVEAIYPLTTVQQGILYHYIKDRDSNLYNLQISFRIYGSVSGDIIKKSLQYVFCENEMLRTIFRWKGIGKSVQIVCRNIEIPIVIHCYEEKNGEEELEYIKKIDRENTIDIENNPIRFIVYSLNEYTHELIITYNQIVMDGWSSSLFIKEFIYGCECYLHDTEPLHKRKQRLESYFKYISNKNGIEEEMFWKEYLLGIKHELYFGNRINDKGWVSTRKIELCLSPEKETQIVDWTKTQNMSLASIFYFALGLLLNKYSNKDDIVFGIVVSGRAVEVDGINDMIGMFVNTIPLRVNLSDEVTIYDVIRNINKQTIDNMPFQTVSHEKLKRCLGNESKGNLFDVNIAFENYPIESPREGDIQVNLQSVYEVNDYPLTIIVNCYKNTEITFIYNVEQISESDASYLATSYKSILYDFLNYLDMKLSEYPLFKKDEIVIEKREIPHNSGHIPFVYDENAGILECFYEVLKKYPQKEAIVDEDHMLTYQQLDCISSSIAHLIVNSYLEEKPVLILLEHSAIVAAAILAVIKSGKTYILLDPYYPIERLAIMVRDSGSDKLIVNSQTVDLAKGLIDFNNLKLSIITIDNISDLEQQDYVFKLSNPYELGQILYTSGTTGKPKGVRQSYVNILHYTQMFSNELKISNQDRITLFASFSHAVATLDLFAALLNGATLFVYDIKKNYNVEKIHKWLNDKKITVFHSVPVLFREIFTCCEDDIMSNVRVVVLGGEAVKRRDFELYKKCCNNNSYFVNFLGSSEVMVATFNILSKQNQIVNREISAGFPASEIEVRIVSTDGTEVAVCQEGEIVYRSKYITEGYLNQLELTKKRIFYDSNDKSYKYYRSGDYGRIMPDGSLEFLGRKDNQVKIRGFRVELAEIESEIEKIENVKQCVVLAGQDEEEMIVLSAFYTTVNDTVLDDEIRSILESKLPDYMIPTKIIMLNSIPLLLNGKIDKSKLEELLNAVVSNSRRFEVPFTQVEKVIARIWSEELREQNIYIDDNFYALGGHSIKAIKVITKMNSELHVRLSLDEFMKNATVRKLAKLIENRETVVESIYRVEKYECYSLSRAQKRIYIQEQLISQNTVYNVPGAILLNGRINVAQLQNAVNQLMMHYDSLRTSFVVKEGEPVQVIHEKVQCNVCICKYITENDVDKFIVDMNKELVKKFDIEKAPLIRIYLVEFSQGKQLLLCDMHHIITDGLSMGIILKNLVKLYNGEEIANLKYDYKDFANWEKNSLTKERMDKLGEYWKRILGEPYNVTRFPYDIQVTERTYAGRSIFMRLPDSITELIRQRAKEMETTVYCIMFAVFQILLYQYTGEPESVIASPFNGRSREEFQEIVGMFVNLVLLRTKIDTNQTFKELLSAIKENITEAIKYQEYPYDVLVNDLNHMKKKNGNDLFHIMFAMEHDTASELYFGDVRGEMRYIEKREQLYDFVLQVIEGTEQITLEIDYSTDVFYKSTIERIAEHYKVLLCHVLSNMDNRLSDYEMIANEETQWKQLQSSREQMNSIERGNINELFEMQVRNNPNAVALQYKGIYCSYKQLNDKASQIATYLYKRGIQKNNIIAIIIEDPIQMVATILGIWKVGGAYLPISSDCPEERMRYMLKNSNAKGIITDCRFVKPHTSLKIYLNLLYEQVDDINGLGILHEQANSDIAYAIYTSGTTGKPKGVIVTHANIYNTIRWRIKEYGMDKSDCSIQLFSYIFDGFLTSVFTPLLSGVKSVLLTNKERANAEVIVNYIKKYGVTHMICIPSLYREILEVGKEQRLPLKIITLAGERVTKDLIDLSRIAMPDIEIINEYGPTECSVVSTFKRNLQLDEVITIGKAIDNVRVYILNDNLKMQPIGVIGEICICGEGVTKGYLGLEQCNQDSFVENSFYNETRLYKTGDYGRLLENGNIEFIGRRDTQVKINGLRIELNEIEICMRSYHKIQDAIVIVKTNKYGSKYIAAYYVQKEEVSDVEIRIYLEKELPYYMLPTHYICLQKLPRLSNGKLDIHNLPDPQQKSEMKSTFCISYMHMWLFDIVKEVLRLEKFDMHSSFLELGGDSLKVIKLVYKIKQEMGVEINIEDVFTKKTLYELADELLKIKKKDRIPVMKAQEKRYYSVTNMQRNIYYATQMEQKKLVYNIPSAFYIEGEFNINKLNSAFQQLVQRHEILRTSFELVEGEIKQVIHEKLFFNCMLIEVKCLSELKLSEYIQPFDFTKAPLMRCFLFQECADKSIIFFDIHHIICDAESIKNLIGELIDIYNGNELNEISYQFRDYVDWQIEYLSKSENIKKQKAYWSEKLSEVKEYNHITTDFGRISNNSFSEAILFFDIKEEVYEKLKEIAIKTGTSIFMNLLSILYILLYKRTQYKDLVVGTSVVSKGHPDFEKTCGVFLNMIPLFYKLDNTLTYEELLQQVKKDCIKAYENSDYPIEMLTAELKQLSRKSLFDVVLTIQNDDDFNFKLAGCEITPYSISSSNCKFDLTFIVHQGKKSLHIEIDYNSCLFMKETIELLRDHFIEIMERILNGEKCTIDEITFQSEFIDSITEDSHNVFDNISFEL